MTWPWPRIPHQLDLKWDIYIDGVHSTAPAAACGLALNDSGNKARAYPQIDSDPKWEACFSPDIEAIQEDAIRQADFRVPIRHQRVHWR